MSVFEDILIDLRNCIQDSDEFKDIDVYFDGLNTDWQSHLEEILSFVSQLQQYKYNLSYMYSQVEKEIFDIMHYIEFLAKCKLYVSLFFGEYCLTNDKKRPKL